MSRFGEIKQAAETPSRGEALFSTLVETIPAGVFQYRDNKTIYVNGAATRISGYTRGELLELNNFWDIVHPDSRPLMMEIYAAHMRGEEIPREYEIKILTKSGDARWVQFTFDWVTSGPEKGDLVGTGVDITERKEAQDALRKKSDQLQAVFDASPDLLLRLDKCGTVLEYLASPDRDLYRSPDVFLGKKPTDLLPVHVGALVMEAVETVVDSRTPATIEYSLPFADGERLFETHVLPFEEEQVLLLARDISRSKRAEESLKESEARLLAFAHAVPDIAFILDEDGTYVEILGRAESAILLVRQAEELKGRRLHDVLPKESADSFLMLIRKTIETQLPQVLEYELDLSIGHRCFEGRTAPLPLEGTTRMVVWLALDITARKKAEEALVELREELDRKAERTVSRGAEHGLTFRELTVLQLVVAGQSDKEIGQTLGISPFTANKHVGNILRKLKVSSRTSASVIAVRDGLVPGDLDTN